MLWIRNLAEFLHIDCNESLINDIAERTQFSKHKAAINQSNRDYNIKQDSVDGTNYIYRKGDMWEHCIMYTSLTMMTLFAFCNKFMNRKSGLFYVNFKLSLYIWKPCTFMNIYHNYISHS